MGEFPDSICCCGGDACAVLLLKIPPQNDFHDLHVGRVHIWKPDRMKEMKKELGLREMVSGCLGDYLSGKSKFEETSGRLSVNFKLSCLFSHQQQAKMLTAGNKKSRHYIVTNLSDRIHVWNVYLHLPSIYAKHRQNPRERNHLFWVDASQPSDAGAEFAFWHDTEGSDLWPGEMVAVSTRNIWETYGNYSEHLWQRMMKWLEW